MRPSASRLQGRSTGPLLGSSSIRQNMEIENESRMGFRQSAIPMKRPPSPSTYMNNRKSQHNSMMNTSYMNTSTGMHDSDQANVEDVILADTPIILNDELDASLSNVRTTKILAKPFDMKKKVDEQTALIKTMRIVLKQAHENLSTGQEAINGLTNDRLELFRRERHASHERDALASELKRSEDDVRKLKDLAKNAQRAAKEKESTLNVVQNDLNAVATGKSSLEQKVGELESFKLEFSQRVQAAEMQVATLRDKLRREEETCADLKERLDCKGKELSAALTSFNTAQQFHQDRTTALQQQVTDLTNARHAIELEFKDCQGALNNLRENNAKQQDSLMSSAHDMQGIAAEKDHYRTESLQLSSQLQILRDQLQELNQSYNNINIELQKALSALAVERESKDNESRQRVDLQDKVSSLASTLDDTKDKLQQSLLEVNNLRSELMNEKEKAITQREEIREAHMRDKDEFARKLESHELKLSATRQELEEKALTMKVQFESEVSVLQEQVKLVQKDREVLLKESYMREQELDRAKIEVDTLRKSVGMTESKTLESMCSLEFDNKSLKMQLSKHEDTLSKITQMESLIATLKDSLSKGEIERRKMHNTIQELKGNIRVLCRIRPFLPHDNESDYCTLEPSADETGVKIYYNGKNPSFTFDRVLPPSATQETVFEEVSQLVQSSLDGYNVCLFSYGQTGSGKTHTMTGGKGEHAGIISRSVRKILDSIQSYNEQGWNYTLEASFSEIYNDKLIDLLDDNAARNPDAKPLEIKRINNRTVVPDLSRYEVSSSAMLDTLMNKAVRNRSTATTDMNERSSRSHCVFTLYLKGINKTQNTQLEGSLHLCDLAGSERVDRSGAVGDRLKEAQAINKSLSCLSDVFSALANGAAHVPFRNSKLTYLLQDCFAGDGKTMMVVNFSPTSASASESMCSLRFANTVSQVHIGPAKKHIQKSGATGGPMPISQSNMQSSSPVDEDDMIDDDSNASPVPSNPPSSGSMTFKRPTASNVPSFMGGTASSKRIPTSSTTSSTTTRPGTAASTLGRPKTSTTTTSSTSSIKRPATNGLRK